jgi:hypothetical protein
VFNSIQQFTFSLKEGLDIRGGEAMTKQKKDLRKRGYDREKYMSHLYQKKREEARQLRKVIASFIAAVKRIPTPRERARRRNQQT